MPSAENRIPPIGRGTFGDIVNVRATEKWAGFCKIGCAPTGEVVASSVDRIHSAGRRNSLAILACIRESAWIARVPTRLASPNFGYSDGSSAPDCRNSATRGSTIRGPAATTSGVGRVGRSSTCTTPPAARTIAVPAAVSHSARPAS